MLYMKSTSGADGSYTLTVTFALGTDPDINTVNVQNRVSLAQPQLPQEVTRRASASARNPRRCCRSSSSTRRRTRYDALFLSNYATINLLDALARVPGVGQATPVRPARLFAAGLARPRPADGLSLTPSDVVAALQAQNVQAALGRIGAAPMTHDQQFQLTIKTQGRLTEPDEFANIVLRANPGRLVRAHQGRGAGRARRQDARIATAASTARRRRSIGIYQSPGANARRGRRQVSRRRWTRLQGASPTTSPTTSSSTPRSSSTRRSSEVDPHAGRGLRARRHRRLPLPRQAARDADPAARRAGLAHRHLRGHAGDRLLGQHRLAARAGARDRHRRRRRHRGRRERRARDRGGAGAVGPPRRPRRRWARSPAPIIAITLVLLSVFVPVAFIPGISGQLFRQFAVAVSVSMLISAINALTLSPALCAVLLKRGARPKRGPMRYVLRRHRQGARRLRLASCIALVRVAVDRRCSRSPCVLGRVVRAVPDDAAGLPAERGPGRVLRRDAAARGRLGQPHRGRGRAGREHPPADPRRPGRRSRSSATTSSTASPSRTRPSSSSG